MKTIKLISDKHFIRELLAMDDVYEQMIYEDSPSIEEFIPQGIWFILLENQHLAGVICLTSINNVMWMPHIYIFGQYRGNHSEKWGKQVAQFMREHCNVKKFLVMTPILAAKKYAERMGFTYVTTLTKSIKKNGKLLDQYVMEME